MRRFAALLVALALVCGAPRSSAQSYTSSPGTTSSTWLVGGPRGIAYPSGGSTGQFLTVSSSTLAAWTTINLQSFTGVAPSTGCLSYTGSAYSWVTCASGAINQLTGDGTAGPGSGSQVLTLASVNSNTGSFGDASHTVTLTLNAKGLVTAASSNAIAITNSNLTAGSYTNITGVGTLTAGSLGAGFTLNLSLPTISSTLAAANGGSGTASPTAHNVLLGEGSSAFGLAAPGTTGFPLVSTGGSSDPAFSATTAITGTGTLTSGSTGTGFTLAFGSSTMTGTVPNANQAAQTLSGDVTGNTGATVVSAISGSSPIAVTPNVLQWIQGASAPQFSQAQQANGSNPVNWKWSPQAPGSSASSTATGTPGNAIVDLASPVSTGTEPDLEVTRGGTRTFLVRPQSGTSATLAQLYLGTPAVSPSNSNYALQSNGSATYINATTNLNFVASSNTWMQVTGSGGNRGLQIGYPGTATFGGGDNVVGISDVITVPTAAATSGGLAIYSNAHVLETNSAGLQFNKLVTNPTIKTQPQTTDTATTTTALEGQNAWASASVNPNGGPLTLIAGAGTSALLGGTTSACAGDGSTCLTVAAPGALASGLLSSSILYNAATSATNADITPVVSGAPNSQTPSSSKFRAVCRTTSSSTVSCGSFSLPTSNTTANVRLWWTARDVTTHATTSDAIGQETCAAVNVAGTVTAINGSSTAICASTGATNVISGSSTNLATLSVTGSISGTTVTIKVGGITGTDTYDWVVDGEVVRD